MAKNQLQVVNNQQVAKFQTPTLPQLLQATILALGTELSPTDRHIKKLELINVTAQLMPAGKPNFLGVVQYPKITDLIQEKGEPVMLMILSIMVRDFCAGFNVVRNMNEDQILEAAAMLLHECDNFRLEDFVMMFALAKRGQLVDIRDRIDLSIITKLLDNYWQKRQDAKDEAETAQMTMLEGLGTTNRTAAPDPMAQGVDGLAVAIANLKEKFSQK